MWIIDLGRDVATRLTEPGREAFAPVWFSDGGHIAYCLADEAPPFLHAKAVGGGEPRVLLPTTGTLQCPLDASPDGRFLLYSERHPTTGYDLWLLPLTGDREPEPWLVTRFDETPAVFSPDGLWVAFESDESGRNEVYVRPFRRPGERRRISTSGGSSPRWRRNGEELFYVDEEGQLMVVPVTPGEILEPGAPRMLFPMGSRRTLNAYDASPDGTRFIVISPMVRSSVEPTVVVNWEAGLPR